MGWVHRGNNIYYYRKERIGSSVHSIYVGRGETATLISQLDDLQREEVQEKCRYLRNERANLDNQEATIKTVGRLIDGVIQASLVSAGLHTHKRQWRKKRG